MRILVALLCALPLFAIQPENYRYNWLGPKTVIPGYTTMFRMNARFSFVFTCDPATDVCTTPDATYVPTNGHTGVVFTTGTLPGGLWGMIGGQWPTYAVCDASGSTFKIRRTNCSGIVEDITSAGTGTHKFALLSWNSAAVYIDNISVPSGWALSFRNGTVSSQTCNAAASVVSGKYRQLANGDTLCLYLAVPAGTAAGNYTPSFRMCRLTDGTTDCNTWTWTVTAVDPSTFPQPAEPPSAAFTAIPGLAAWEARMINGTDGGGTGGGAAWCDKANVVPQVIASPGCAGSNGVRDVGGYSNDICGGSESSPWYYDGADVYLNIANYTRDAAWNKCAVYVGLAHRDYSFAGSTGWRQFPDSLVKLQSRANNGAWDGSYKAALVSMLSKNGSLLYGTNPNPAFLREMTYAVLDDMEGEKIGKVSAYAQANRDAFFSTLLMCTESDSAYQFGSNFFMYGLAERALERLWEQKRDKRAPYLMKRVLDRIIANYSLTSHSAHYGDGHSPDAACFNGGDMPWFQNMGNAGGCDEAYYDETTGTGTLNRLNNLMSHGFAWFWRYFYDGTNTYRDIGDDMFQYGLGSGFSAKEFSQNYRESFNFVRWRSGR